MAHVIESLKSGTAVTVAATILATGGYVVYKDGQRYPRMIERYSRGSIVAPLAENPYEVAFYKRKTLGEEIRGALNSSFSNQYYLVKGEVGTGKTRLIVETVRQMIEEEATNRGGAPVYVSVAQGKSFPDSLAEAVGFLYDEHISFRSLLDLIFHTHSMPARDDFSKLRRVLNAIEQSAFRYMTKTGRPMVLVVDGANALPGAMPNALQMIQEKAKLWADTNIAKVVFISNDEDTEDMLKESSSNWSRAAAPICVGDLSFDEVTQYLSTGRLIEASTKVDNNSPIPQELVQRIYDSVGGRIHHLMAFKRCWLNAIPFEEILTQLKGKERAKFVIVGKSAGMVKAICDLRKAPSKTMLLSALVLTSSQEDVHALASENIIRYERQPTGIVVKFESRLTEVVVDELMSTSY